MQSKNTFTSLSLLKFLKNKYKIKKFLQLRTHFPSTGKQTVLNKGDNKIPSMIKSVAQPSVGWAGLKECEAVIKLFLTYTTITNCVSDWMKKSHDHNDE